MTPNSSPTRSYAQLVSREPSRSLFSGILGLLPLALPAGAALWVSAAAQAAPTWQVFQITSGSVNDVMPDVSGTTYVWERIVVTFNDTDVMMWSEGDPAPVKISTTRTAEIPHISGGRVVWYGSDGGADDYEIWLWENGVATALTDNTLDETQPDIGGTGIVWRRQGGILIYFDGQQQVQLTDGSINGQYPQVMNDLVTWETASPVSDIYYWKNGAQVQLTDNGAQYDNYRPHTDGNAIVWYSNNGPSGGYEVWRWTEQGGITRITSNSVSDSQPAVSGDVIVFLRNDGQDREVFFNYLGVDYQITDNAYDESDPEIDGDRIVWSADMPDGSRNIFYAILSGLDGGEIVGACCVGMDCTRIKPSECAAIGGTFMGPETFCDIDACPEFVRPADGWSTHQHDFQRTGRTAAIVPAEPTRLWSLLLGTDFQMHQPVVGPDGTVYAAAHNYKLAAIYPDGAVRWTWGIGYESAFACPTIRNDGHFYVPRQSYFSKWDYRDGTELCRISGQPRNAAVMDSLGYVYFTSSGALKKMDPGCNTLWTTPNAGGALAMGSDGGVYAVGARELSKFDPQDGQELWAWPTVGDTGEAAVGQDGTIYFIEAPNILTAVNPDGSGKWILPLAGLDDPNPSPPPALAADGTIYAVVNSSPIVVAVSAEGDELWRFTDPDPDGYDAFSPVVDGSGTIFFAAKGGGLFALSPVDGAELLRFDLGAGDHPAASPAIGDDGTLYVHTENGYLIAFGEGCPEPYYDEPRYTYRKVVSEGDTVAGYPIDRFEDFEIGYDGRVVFKAEVPSTGFSGVFTERADGGFDAIVHGSTVGGKAIDRVALPRRDDQGNTYMPAQVVGVGPAIFFNDQMYLREGPPPEVVVAPIILHDYEDTFFDIDSAGMPMLFGRITENSPESILRVRTDIQEAEELLRIGTIVDALGNFNMERDARYRRMVNASGSYVAAGSVGVLRDGQILVYEEDTIGGYKLYTFDRAQINDNGDVHFWGSWALGEGVFTPTSKRVGTGDTVDGLQIGTIENYEVNNAGQLAYTSVLADGRNAVFLDDQTVAVPAQTTIEGQTVEQVITTTLSLNNAGQTAFVADVGGLRGVYIATPTGIPSPPFTYEAVLREEQTLNGLERLEDFYEIHLSDGGLLSARLEEELVIDVVAFRVSDMSHATHFDVADDGRFCGSVRQIEGGPSRISLVDPQAETVAPVWTIGQTFAGFTLSGISSGQYEQRLVNNDGDMVISAWNPSNASAILHSAAGVVARAGTSIGGYNVINVSRPEIPNAGAVNFLATYDLGGGNQGSGVFTAAGRRVGTGDVLAGQTVGQVLAFAVNDAGQLAVVVQHPDLSDGLYLDGVPVCIEQQTQIDQGVVNDIETNRVRMNQSGQVAFRARSGAGSDTLYVATPTGLPETPFTYRSVAIAGSVVGGLTLHSITDYRMFDDGLTSIFADYFSYGGQSYPYKIVVETSEGVFDGYAAGGSLAGLTVQAFGTAPRRTAGGTTYIIAQMTGIGAVVFADGTPVLQSENYAPIGAYVMETAPGVFDEIYVGDEVGGPLITNLALSPRIDDDGNAYFLATTDAGATLFRNGQPLVQEDVPGATAPIRLALWYSEAYIFDVTNDDHVLLYGRSAGDPAVGLLLVDAIGQTVEQLFVDATPFPGWPIETIEISPFDERHEDAGDRTFVVRGGGREAVMLDNQAHVRDGKEVAGKTLTSFSAPQLYGGAPIFLADFAGGNGLFTASQQIVATGDVRAGQTIASIVAHSENGTSSAYTAILANGRKAVFRGSTLIALENTTTISGQTIQTIDSNIVRRNAGSLVAFVASTTGAQPAIYVRQGIGVSPPFRRAAGIGDVIDGVTVVTLEDLRLDNAGLVSFRSGTTPSNTAVFRETSAGNFDTFANNVPLGGLTINHALGRAFAPRMTAAGVEVVCIPVAPVGPVVFVARQPFAQKYYPDTPDANVYLDTLVDWDYVDHDESGRFLVHGKVDPADVPALLEVDTQTGGIRTVISASNLSPSPVDGYGDDGQAVVLRTTGAGAIITPTTTIVSGGDIVDGYMIGNLGEPRRTAGGVVYYIADRKVFRYAGPGDHRVIRKFADSLNGQAVATVDDVAVNDWEEWSYIAGLFGTGGLFVNDQTVAIRNVTKINGQDIYSLSEHATPNSSINNAGQILFEARRVGETNALWVADPAQPFDRNTDGEVNLIDYGFLAECFSGPGDLMPAGCEVFDVNGDCRCDMLDLALFQNGYPVPQTRR